MRKRIIVESGGYGLYNMGDIAMLQVAVERIAEFWPSAQVEVTISRPNLLARFCPQVMPISADERNAWLSSWDMAIGFRERLPEALSRTLVRLERAIWLRLPRVTDLAVRVKSKLLRRRFIPPENFRRRLKSSNLVVVCGMGMINDAFAELASRLLDELEVALDAGIPVVAFGQGLGPISDRELLKKARSVLQRLTFISLREGYSGLPLLEALGVPRDRTLVTGDDAVELAFRSRPSALGNAIGINCRLASYAGTDEELVDELRAPLTEVAAVSKRPLQS
ncbi:MAG: polysaccharide pyruvyl transferase family protein, partial [Terracidiphilus sp.]